MRTYILTELERKHLRKYLETSETSDALYVLLNRILNNIDRLNKDLSLIERVIEKRRLLTI